MKTPLQRSLRTLMLCAPLASAALVSACEGGSGGDGDAGADGASLPTEFAQYLVYVADGVYDPADPNWEEVTLEDVQRGDWGWNDQQIADFEQDAKDFFLERFGVDVDDPANEGRFHFAPVLLEPRARYRVTTMGGRDVGPEGWLLSDGAWQVIFDDPDGYELGGTLPGYVVPATGFLVYGYYQIVPTEGEGEPFFIGFKSFSPLITDPTGLGVFRCQIWADPGELSEEAHSGVAHGVFRLHQEDDGMTSFNIRNVLTFDE